MNLNVFAAFNTLQKSVDAAKKLSEEQAAKIKLLEAMLSAKPPSYNITAGLKLIRLSFENHSYLNLDQQVKFYSNPTTWGDVLDKLENHMRY